GQLERRPAVGRREDEMTPARSGASRSPSGLRSPPSAGRSGDPPRRPPCPALAFVLAHAPPRVLDCSATVARSARSMRAAELRRSSPLIFFNACHSGRLGFTLLGLGSWGAEMIRLGCGAFVGSLWPVRDEAAVAFAECFYRSLGNGAPIG